MAQRVLYPDHIEPLVQFVEETTPERIVAATHDKLTAGTPVKDMLLASALAVVAPRICRPAITADRSTRWRACTPFATSRRGSPASTPSCR